MQHTENVTLWKKVRNTFKYIERENNILIHYASNKNLQTLE